MGYNWPMDGLASTNGARRCRRYRARKKAGAVVVPAEITPEAAMGLVDCGLLDINERGDRARVAEAVELVLYIIEENAFVIDDEWFDSLPDAPRVAPA